MAENNNNRLSRKDRLSQERKSVMPGGYISRRNNNPTNSGQQPRPLTNEEIMRRGGVNSSRQPQPQRDRDQTKDKVCHLHYQKIHSKRLEVIDQEDQDDRLDQIE